MYHPVQGTWPKIAEESEDNVPTWDNDREGAPTVGKTLSEVQKEELMDLVGKFFRCTWAVPMSQNIQSTLEMQPQCDCPLYQLPHAYCGEIQQELKEMLHYRIIEPSHSDWAAPMVLVKKKMGLCRCARITGA